MPFGGETEVSGVEIVLRGFPRRERDRRVLSATEEEAMSWSSEREVISLDARSMVSSLSLRIHCAGSDCPTRLFSAIERSFNAGNCTRMVSISDHVTKVDDRSRCVTCRNGEG